VNNLESLFAAWNRTDVLSLLLLAYIISFSVRHIVFYLGNVAISRQRFLLTRDLQMDLFDSLMRTGMRFYDSAKTGYIMNSLYNETIRIGNFINCILRIFAMSVRVLVNVGILFFISWQWTLAALGIFAVVRVPLYLIVNKIRAIGIAVNKATADFNFTVLEMMSGIRVIRAFSGEKRERRKFKETADRCYECNYANLKLSETLLPLTHITFLGIFLVAVGVFIRVARIDMVKVIPFIVAYLYVAKNALTDLSGLQDRRAEAASYLGAFDSYEKFLKETEATREKNGTRQFDGLKEGIRFEDVHFAYTAGKTVLDGFCLDIPKGKITAIVGSSGIGKTTIINLLLGFYEIPAGRITVDGADLKEIDLHSWRAKIGVVSQDVFVFNASARENIAYGRPNASDEEVRAASRVAGISGYLEGLPEGYNTLLGERGVKVSGGQRQRISIARAVIQDPEMLILDEATSHLDSETEREIQSAIDGLTRNRTVIIVAHRLSTIHSADKIVVLDKGRIVEDGTHKELMARGGAYRKLYETQFTASE
jgi:subfamily B ATP-binding cassette protein MsbA